MKFSDGANPSQSVIIKRLRSNSCEEGLTDSWFSRVAKQDSC
jgi:hypothetical protein